MVGYELATRVVHNAMVRIRSSFHYDTLGRPMSCMPGYFEVINTHTVGSLSIPRASIK